jgi:hypothetical protein
MEMSLRDVNNKYTLTKRERALPEFNAILKLSWMDSAKPRKNSARYTGRNSNRADSEYKSRVLTP